MTHTYMTNQYTHQYLTNKHTYYIFKSTDFTVCGLPAKEAQLQHM